MAGAATSDIDALISEAITLRRAGRLQESAVRFDLALQRAPQHAGALTSYAMLLLDTGDVAGAIDLGRRGVAADPSRTAAHHVLGHALCRNRELTQGIAHLRRALALRPDAFDVHVHLAQGLADAGARQEAEAHFLEARSLAPDNAAIAITLGNFYRRSGNADAAVAAYGSAIAIAPQLPHAYNNLGNVLLENGDADAAIVQFRQALERGPDRPGTWSNLLLAFNRSDTIADDEFVRQHRAFGDHFGERLPRLPRVPLQPFSSRRLKIGYVSSDFVDHAVALFFEPLLAAHDRSRFEVYCFHNSDSSDEMTERIEALAEHFVSIAGKPDGDVAALIRAEGIDILVDLNGHTAGNRLPLFVLRPAPIQVTWLGYLGTTGVSAIDYRLTDTCADPVGMTEHLHVESLWRLPETAWCYKPYTFAPSVGPPPLAGNGYVTFASTNAPGKLSITIVTLWAQILAAIPGARLVMIATPLTERRESIARIFADHGIASSRIEYLQRQSTAAYLALYNRVDIALDSWPCAGGTTSCDALWMGVPVIALAGTRSFSRSGASLLSNVALQDLVAQRPQDYVANAVALAGDRMRLAQLRESLRERIRASPLVDAPRFARAVESAYSAMAMRLSGAA